MGLSPLPRPAALHQLCSNRQQQAVAAIIRYAKEHVSLRAPFLLFSISSTPDRLCTSSVACPHLPPLLFFGASHGLHWHAAVQRRRSCLLFRDSTAFPPQRFSRRLLPMRTLPLSGPLLSSFIANYIAIIATSLSSPLSPRLPSLPSPPQLQPRSRSCMRAPTAAYAALQLQPRSCSAAVCAKHTE